jgi:putative ABC transport system permease protein
VPNVAAVSPIAFASVQVVNGNQNWFTRAYGASPEYTQIRNWPVVQGSSFSQRDVDVAANVCVIGHTIVTEIFGDEDPVGKVIRVKSLPFRVLGVLETKGQSPTGEDQDDVMIMPYTTVEKKISGNYWLQLIMVSASSQQVMQQVEDGISALLRQRHHLRTDEDNDFIIRSPNEFAQAAAASSLVMTILLGAIASISLLVGGIGIMNIMLVSVTERTREIGVRMAVGATEEDVQRQFLSEAVVLSSLGGIVGILLGVIGSAIISRILGWSTFVSPSSVLIAAMFSAGVGIFFGYYPARKAARLDPIEALRYE